MLGKDASRTSSSTAPVLGGRTKEELAVAGLEERISDLQRRVNVNTRKIEQEVTEAKVRKSLVH